MTNYKVKDVDEFQDNILAADQFLDQFPEIINAGVEITKTQNVYYITKNGKIVNPSAFFTFNEMPFLEQIH